MKKYLTGIVILAILFGAWFFTRARNAASSLYENNPAMADSPAQNPSAQEAAGGANINPGNFPERDSPVGAQSVAAVIYTEQGFIPETITVKKGEAIAFKNKSGRDMWVGSNPHPTHTLYPEKSVSDCLGSSFDTCKGVPAGTDWLYTFNSVGTWRYHDHLRESNRGTVVVE